MKGVKGVKGTVVSLLCACGLVGAACDRQPSSPGNGTSSKPGPTGDWVFTEITESVGLDFAHFIGASGEYYIPEIMSGGCAVLDYDLDGDLDVYAVQGALLGKRESMDEAWFPPAGADAGSAQPRNHLYRNDLIAPEGRGGTVKFADVTDDSGTGDTQYGMGCAVGDYDNDGYPDLYVTNFGPNVLYHNNGDGTFTNVTDTAGVGNARWSVGAAFLDYDRDRLLDLYVTTYVDYGYGVHHTCRREGGRIDYCGPLSHARISSVLYHNNGDGTFTDVTLTAGIAAVYGYGLGAVCADFDGDGWIDIYAANDASPNQLWINQKDGTFVDNALVAGVSINLDGQDEASMGLTAGDFDRDGDEDIFLTHEMNETNTLYRNEGNGLFVDATIETRLSRPSLGRTGFGTQWFDYDHDGWLDLFVTNGAMRMLDSPTNKPWPIDMPDQLYRNVGGRFVETTREAGPALAKPYAGRAVAFGDVDNDGDIDLLVMSSNGPLRLLRNNVGNRKPWIRLRLEGTRSNRDAFGARVAVALPDGVTLWSRAHTDGSYCAANDPRIHVGLGDATKVESVTVHWPNGGVERWTDIPLKKQTTLREGEGRAVE